MGMTKDTRVPSINQSSWVSWDRAETAGFAGDIGLLLGVGTSNTIGSVVAWLLHGIGMP